MVLLVAVVVEVVSVVLVVSVSDVVVVVNGSEVVVVVVVGGSGVGVVVVVVVGGSGSVLSEYPQHSMTRESINARGTYVGSVVVVSEKRTSHQRRCPLSGACIPK